MKNSSYLIPNSRVKLVPKLRLKLVPELALLIEVVGEECFAISVLAAYLFFAIEALLFLKHSPFPTGVLTAMICQEGSKLRPDKKKKALVSSI